MTTEHDELTAVWPVALEAIEPPPHRAADVKRAVGDDGRALPTYVGVRSDVASPNGHLPLGQARVVALADLARAEREARAAEVADDAAAETVKRALEARKRTSADLDAAKIELARTQNVVAYRCGLK